MVAPILDLITSYQSRLSAVEELLTAAYDAAVAFEGSFTNIDSARARLLDELQKVLARNCSLRKKDFGILRDRIISQSEYRRRRIDTERKQLRQTMGKYLAEQMELTARLRQQLINSSSEENGRENLTAVIDHIKVSNQDSGRRLFLMLHEHQQKLAAFEKEQAEINRRFEVLLSKGTLLTIDDFRAGLIKNSVITEGG